MTGNEGENNGSGAEGGKRATAIMKRAREQRNAAFSPHEREKEKERESAVAIGQ